MGRGQSVFALAGWFVTRVTCQDVRVSQIVVSDLGAREYFYTSRGTNTLLELVFWK
jgi:hypothetical protein